MMPSIGVQLFWMISLGLIVGYIAHFAYLKYSVPTLLSIGVSTAGALIIGLLAYFFAFEMPLVYALLGSVTFLFVANVFLSQE